MSNPETYNSFLKRIKNRRRSIKLFVKNLQPKGARLTNFNIICSAIATILTAAPVIGGKTLLDVFGASNSNSLNWRIFFAVASVFSLMSTIAANVYKSHDMASRLAKAQTCDAKLEGLEALLEAQQIDLKNAATQYTQLISDISFISDESGRMLTTHSSLDWVSGEISYPESNQIIDNSINCLGWVEGHGTGVHLWLATEISGHIWPKEGELYVNGDGSWNKKIIEEGAGDTFSLSLFVANKKANKKIRNWLDKADQTGDYSELRRLPGLRRIARVDNLHRKKLS